LFFRKADKPRLLLAAAARVHGFGVRRESLLVT
jgi:hypothetical protein